ncbi:MAG: superfamily II DNA or RNA helicase [Planctomycetota bacterium]
MNVSDRECPLHSSQILSRFADGARFLGFQRAAGHGLYLERGRDFEAQSRDHFSVWKFQSWFRGKPANALGFNLPGGLRVSFLPEQMEFLDWERDRLESRSSSGGRQAPLLKSMQLRPYQQQALEAVRAAYKRKHRRVLVVMPTGTGKTVLFAEISRLAKGPVLVLAHRQELVEQARDKISKWCDDVVAVEMAGRREFTRPRAARPKITVASIQTLQRRLEEMPRDAFRIVVIDEAHHSTADSFRAVIDHFHAHILGVTATPDRSDGTRLGEVFSEVAFDYDMLTATDEGWLAPISSFLVKTKADFSGIRKIAGELATRDVEAILTKDLHLVEIADPILRERKGRPAIVFAASVAHSKAMARVLCELSGDSGCAASLDGTHTLEERAKVIGRFRAGEIKVLVNCSLFTEGFDVPEIALVAIARPVLSRSFYAQMVGRGTRIAPGKKDLLVLDFVPVNCRHSLVQAVDIFGRDKEEVLERARAITAAASEAGQAMALEKALELARQEQEAQEADVAYQLVRRDPYASVGIDLEPFRRKAAGGEPASKDQLLAIKKAGLPVELIDDFSSYQVEKLREHLLDRKAVGLCTPKQAKKLLALGLDPREVYYDEAKALLKKPK